MAASYTAGDLRHRGTIEVSVKTPNGSGGNTVAWTPFAVRALDILPLSGAELFRAQQIDATISHKIVARYLPGVLAKMRVRVGTRVFDIRAVVDVEEKHEWLELTCIEYAP